MNSRDQEKLVYIGESLKLHGYKGEIKCSIQESVVAHVENGDFLFFDMDGAKVPLRIKNIRGSGTHVISFEDKSVEEIKEFCNRSLYAEVDPELIKQNDGEEIEFLGYNIFSEGMEYIGTIVRVEEQTTQLLAGVENKDTGKRYLIPLIDAWIKETNTETEYLIMDLPDGLLDL